MLLIGVVLTGYVALIAAVSFVTVRHVAPGIKGALGAVESSTRAPVKASELGKSLPGIPLYPGAKFNAATTNNPALRFISRNQEGFGATAAAFDTNDDLPKVIRWYQQNLRGWRRIDGFDGMALPFELPVQSAAFMRGGRTLAVLPGISRRGLGVGSFILYATGMQPPVDLTALASEVQAHPQDAKRRLQLARAYQSYKRYQSALSEFALLANSRPQALKQEQRFAVMVSLGDCHWHLRQNQLALRAYRRALRWSDTVEEREVAVVLISRVLKSLGRFGEAETLLLEALNAPEVEDPGWIHACLADLYHELGRLNDAVEEYERADALGAPGIRVNRTRAELALGNPERARAVLQAATLGERRYLSRFLERGPGRSSRRAWAGIQLTGISTEWAQSLGLPQPGGIWVEEVVMNSPAWQAGLRRQEVILEVAGVAALQREDLMFRLRAARPGDMLELDVWRGGKHVPTRLRLGSILE